MQSNFLYDLYSDFGGGYTYLWTMPDKKTYWFNSGRLDEMQKQAGELSEAGKDVYFGVGITKDPKFLGRAKSADVCGLPGLWIDIDFKDAAAHAQTDLPETLEEIISRIPLAPSILVHSGHGVHLYWLLREPWIFDDAAERQAAEKLLHGFQAYIKQQLGYKIDSTHDLARVLRLPGTKNYKNEPVDVRVLKEDTAQLRYNPEDFEPFTVPDIAIGDYEEHGRFKRLPTDGIAQIAIDNCQFLQHCRDHAERLTYYEWLAMVSNIARCKNGPEAVHELSAPYPKYSAKETDKKIQNVLNMNGPLTCRYIQQHCNFMDCPSGGCGVKAPCAFSLRNGDTVPPAAGIDSVVTGEKDIPHEPLTDMGNAERFFRQHSHHLKYCPQFGTWLIWDGIRHKIDDTGQIISYAKETVRSFHEDILHEMDPDKRKRLFMHAQKSESLPRIKAMLELSQHMFAVHVDELDQNKWLLNVKNGCINLKTGQLLPHDQEQLITKLAPVTYDADAACPRFMQFMTDVFDHNANIIQFMQRLLGYSLTGDTSEQVMAFAYGAQGSNGKSTLLELFLNILGDYGETTASDTFTLKHNEGIPNDIARLRGARFVKISELKENTKLNEALIKQITGQDKLTARFLRQEFFSFMPAFKLMILTNHKPRLTGDDPALWRRIVLIPFLQRFTGERKDKHLPEKLAKEWSGILNWCLTGCLEWQRIGLEPPEEVRQATKEYQSESDVLNNWVSDCCLARPNLQTKTAMLFNSYESWCEENAERNYLSRNKFTQKLVEKGFEVHRGTKGVRFIRGLALLDLERDIDLSVQDAERPF